MKLQHCTCQNRKRILGLLVVTSMMMYIMVYKLHSINYYWMTVAGKAHLLQEYRNEEVIPSKDDFLGVIAFPNKGDFLNDVLEKHPMLPMEFLHNSEIKRKFNNSCAKFPSLFNIKIDNLLWQHVHLSTDKDLYLFSAYFDGRKTVLNSRNNNRTASGPVIRLLGMTDQSYKQPFKAMCQFWYKDEPTPTFSENVTYDYIWNFKFGYKENISIVGILITCPLQNYKQFKIPDVVSFVENKCDDAKSAMRIQRPEDPIPEAPPKGSIAVCIKSMTFYYNDLSHNLVEWIEVMRQLGAQKVYTYELALHPNVKKVLQYYENTGYVDIKPYTLPGSQGYGPELLSIYLKEAKMQMRFNEIIPYNDCLYRNWYRYEYLVVIDTDEIIVPARPEVMTWNQLLSEVVRNATSYNTFADAALTSSFPYSSICGRNVHFVNNATDMVKHGLPDDIPPYLYMLTHVSRAPNFESPGSGVKCFHATSRVLTLHNHFAFKCVDGCRAKQMDPTVAHMQHYRSDCTVAPISRCSVNAEKSETIIDTTVWKYKEKVIENSKAVMEELGMI